MIPSLKSTRLEFSTHAFGLFAVASVVSLPLLNLRGVEGDFLTLIGIGLAVTAATGFLFFLLSVVTERTRQRLSNRRNNELVIFIVGAIGLIRGYFSYVGLEILGFEQFAVLPTRLFTSTITTLLWLTLAIYVISSYQGFKADFSTFINSSFVALAKIDPTEFRKIPPAITEEIKEIETQIQSSLDSIYAPLISKETLTQAARLLRECVEVNIRPLSHRLWLQSGRNHPKIKFWAILKEGIGLQNFPPFFTIAFLVLLSTLNLSTTLGSGRALMSGFILLIVISGYFYLQRRYLPIHTAKITLLKILNLLLPGFLVGLCFLLINKYYFEDDLGLFNFIFIPMGFAVFLSAAAIYIAHEDRSVFIEHLYKDLNSRFPNFQGLKEDQSGKEVAAFLHNSVQSELLALSYQLEELSNDPDSEETRATLEKLASSLSSQIGKNFENFNEKPHERLYSLEKAWAGIAQVTFSADPIEISKFSQAHIVVQVIEEAISNAVRAARATRIRVAWQFIDVGGLQLTITDNGGIETQGDAGLGTQWLQEIAFGRWSREATNGETVLKVTFSE
jgi:signal transduction histidine kinase